FSFNLTSVYDSFLLTSLSFSLGISNTHLNLESINSSVILLLLTTVVCTINLCLLFSFGS
uniref:Uncharacterized protein n=1 Tax=Melopsittacus undulatus TaxID=13146 RepID=A0A8V5G1D6_MELUD